MDTSYSSVSELSAAKVGGIRLEYTIDKKDELDAGKSSFLMIESSVDNGHTWRDVAGFGWVGGEKCVDREGNPTKPAIRVGPCPHLKGAQMRVRTLNEKEIAATMNLTAE